MRSPRQSYAAVRLWFVHVLTGSALLWIVATATVSVITATFSFRQAAQGLDRVVALSDARKASRQALVSLLDQEAGLRYYAASHKQQTFDLYTDAYTNELRTSALLDRFVRRINVAGTRAHYAAYRQASTQFHRGLLQRLAVKQRAIEADTRDLALCRQNLEALIDDFNSAGNATVKLTDLRLFFAGAASVVLTLVLGIGALVTEALRRRAAAKRNAELADKVEELQRAQILVARTDALQAGKDALEFEIKERVEAERRLEFQAFHDSLTGLPNRAHFVEKLNEINSRTVPAPLIWGILFLDLDGFKVINDSLGHLAGDRLLSAVARRLERCLRAGDTLARLGGDEFTILLDDIEDTSVAAAVADRVLHEFTEPFEVGEREIFVAASIGIATNRDWEAGETPLQPAEILRNADLAMYHAKQRGKKRHERYSPSLLARSIALLDVQNDLVRALERQELALVYQPIVDLQSGALSGFEALVRWQHPTRGVIMPSEFIPVAEDNGSIIALGEWILLEACRQMQSWRVTLTGAARLHMSVNVSTKQLASSQFLESLDRALQQTGLDPTVLNAEITESALIENANVTCATLRSMRQRGISIHLDDFGTGYSSLAYLHEFPIDTLKIDRSFVSGPSAGVSNPAIVRAIIALARSLDITITAEGIETELQLTQLRELTCSSGQGYYLSPPVDAERAAGFIGADLVHAGV